MKSIKAHLKTGKLVSVVLLGAFLGVIIPQIGLSPGYSQQVPKNQITVATEPSQINQEEVTSENTRIVEMSSAVLLVAILAAGIVVAVVVIIQGCVKIGDNEVGIVIKRFNLNPGHPKLPYGSIAFNGEAGCQADTLAPGRHFGYWPWMYTICKEPLIRVKQGEIALVMANDGQTLSSGRKLGKAIPASRNFQDARAFLMQGGEKGRQIEVLPAGDYRINTRLFTVITSDNAGDHNLAPKNLRVYRVEPGMLGIVTTLEGKTLPSGEMAGPKIPGHDNFQNGQKFIDGVGYMGLQEEVLLEGAWQLNPWFVEVEQRPLTHILAGTVGVVISHVGKDTVETLVEPGCKGVWKTPLYPRKHPVNTKVMDIVIVPTHDITLDWSNKKTKQPENYDSQLHALKIYSKDGFLLNIEVTQVIRIYGKDAPTMISRVGSPGSVDKQVTISQSTGVIRFASIRSLVNRVLEPMVGNYFYQSAQGYEALNFHDNRADRQGDAIDYIKKALIGSGVEPVGTYINEIDLPDVLENIRNGIKIAEQEGKLYEAQRLMEVARRQFVYEQALTEIQKDLVRFEQGIKIADFKAIARRYESLAEADATRAQGKAQAEIMQAIVDVMGQEGFLDVEKLKQLTNLKLPDVWVSGSDAGNSGSVQALIASILRPGNSINASNPVLINGTKPSILPKPSSEPAVAPALTEPRCPIVLLLDTSVSMSSEYINQLTDGLITLKRKVLEDAMASRRTEIAVIKFGSPVETVQDFTAIDSFYPPRLLPNGDTTTGQGIEKGLDILEQRKAIYASNNLPHYKPWMFLISGSAPTDSYQNAARLIAEAATKDNLIFFVVGVQGINISSLGQLTPPNGLPPVMLDGLKFQELFYWLADAVKKVVHNQVGSDIDLPPITTWARING